MSNEKIKVILDCDPGHDDAIAILVAGLSNKIDLKGLSIIAGNQAYEKVTKNALKICDYLQIDKPVYGGMKGPLLRPQIVASDFHGETGLDGIKLPDTDKQLEKEHSVNFIINTVMNSDNDITLVPVGPLTNIAMALKLEPAIKDKIEKIVLMGGSCKGGNATKYAEFNIHADPEAAHIVFSSGVPVYMMGLDVTNLTSPNAQIAQKIKDFNTKESDFLYQALHFPKRYDENGNFIYHTLHDVVTLAYLIDNDVVTLEKMGCKIEIKDKEKYGKTICSNCNCNVFTDEEINNSNVFVATEINLDRFWNILFDIIK